MSDGLLFGLVTGIAVGLAAGYLGGIMVLEKMALVGDALSHVALPGLALGILLGFDPILGGFAFLFVSAAIIWQISRVTKLSFETIVGAVFTLALAIGILMMGQNLDALEAALFGDISTVGLVDAIFAVIVSGTAILLTRLIYKQIVISMISEELAISQGINVPRINLLYLLLVSLVVALGIKVTGTLLVGFLVVTPAAAAKNMSSNLFRYSALSSVFGAVSAFSGVFASGYLNLPSVPPGPMVVIAGVIVFLLTILVRWKTKMNI
jgi:ABC-type Mn2+/Zn2+ transport system permease subunit